MNTPTKKASGRKLLVFTALTKQLLLLMCLFLSSEILGFAATTTHLTIDELKKVQLPDVVLESVTAVKADAQLKPPAVAHVSVKGVIGGHIRFELLLPETWNGRFAMGGGGGFVGTVQNGAIASLAKGFATVGTDTGHQSGPSISAKWALDDLEAKVNFGYLAIHRTAEVAKALIRSYYGKEATHSYFLGCSRGGGQAMMEAQRFPNDFAGVVAGAPAFNWTGIAANAVEISKALYPDSTHLDSTVLTKDALQKLAAGIMDQCDAQDGLKDGIIGDPPSAHFDLSKVTGLTAEQRKAIEVIYRGPSHNQKKLYPGYAPVAECVPDQWIAWITGPAPALVARDGAPDLMFAFGTQIFKYLIFNQPDWDYSKYDFSNFDQETKLAASYLNATDADLTAFKARKGKLILWHGWADPALPAEATVEYYREVQARDAQAHDYCRLFMVPGCLHCGGGPGASEIDWLSVITDWVEKDKTPEVLVASKTENGKVIMTRPLFPYPEHAAYKGTGDANNAENFEARTFKAEH